MDEQARPDATTNEHAYALVVEEAAQRYEAAGHPRTHRAIQKYCMRGDLDCQKEETTYGQRYRITPASVVRHLAQIEQVSQTKRRDRTRPDATVRMAEVESEGELRGSAPIREQARPDATDERYVVQLEKQNDRLLEQLDRKDRQIDSRDRQIEAMIERDRETNILIQQLQQRIPQLVQGERGEALTPTTHETISGEPTTGG